MAGYILVSVLNVGYVPPPHTALWPDLHRMLDKAVQDYANDWDEVAAKLRDQRAQLWLAVDEKPVAALVTQVLGDKLEIWLAGGEILRVMPWFKNVIEASKAAGTTGGIIFGRRGWERVLKDWRYDDEGYLVKDW